MEQARHAHDRPSAPPQPAVTAASRDEQDLLFSFRRLGAPGLRRAALRAVQAMAAAEGDGPPD